MPAIDRLLLSMLEKKASDLHICSNVIPQLRQHGEIVPVENMKELHSETIQKLINEISPEKNRIEFEENNDTDFAYDLVGHGRFRVNVFRDRCGVGAVLRQIPMKIPTMEQLNLPPVVKKFCGLHKGLVLVTGPTGSGKSTTLAAMIDHINETRADHIITIEDPVEFVHPNKKALVNQREIRTHTLGFKNALRAALREDPDIVLVGELRDLETTEIALETAETGHLVFGTLHTNTAVGTVDRIINQFPADRQSQIRMMLSETLKGVVAQNLLKRADGSGRVAALEILVSTPAISNCIREGKTYQVGSAMQTGKKFGMQLLNDDLMRLAKEKIIKPEDAYLKAVDKDDIATKLKMNGFDISAVLPISA